MNKEYFAASVITFIVSMLGSLIVHGALVQGDYGQLTTMFRTGNDAQQFFPFMLLAQEIMSGTFVWVYLCGIKSKP